SNSNSNSGACPCDEPLSLAASARSCCESTTGSPETASVHRISRNRRHFVAYSQCAGGARGRGTSCASFWHSVDTTVVGLACPARRLRLDAGQRACELGCVGGAA